MTLEKQVCSLELSKKLKELGVKQESLFYWHEKSGNLDFYNHFSPSDRDYPAFTVTELGEMLPCRSKKMDTMNNAELVSTKLVNVATGKTIWTCAYWDEDKNLYLGMVVRFDGDTEADARAKMLVYLIENKLITL